METLQFVFFKKRKEKVGARAQKQGEKSIETHDNKVQKQPRLQ